MNMLSRLTLPEQSKQGAPELSVKNLHLYYGERQILNNVSLNIKAGSIQALVGPSGCGKSSFLQCVNRLAEHIPGYRLEGDIHIDQQSIYDEAINITALRRHVGMVFQRPNPFPMSIYENLAFPLREHGIRNDDDIYQRIEQTLERVGLWQEIKGRLGSSALRLSGGQQQRLCIARTLILQPGIILLDEPCSALDPLSTGVIETLIEDLRGQYTCLIVTHNLAQARRIADNVAVFWLQNTCGEIIEYGPTEAIFMNPQHRLTADYIDGRQG